MRTPCALSQPRLKQYKVEERHPAQGIYLGKAGHCLSWPWQWRDFCCNTSRRPLQGAPLWWWPASTSCCRWRTWTPPPPPPSRGRTRVGCRPPGLRTSPSPWDGYSVRSSQVIHLRHSHEVICSRVPGGALGNVADSPPVSAHRRGTAWPETRRGLETIL